MILAKYNKFVKAIKAKFRLNFSKKSKLIKKNKIQI